MAAHRHLRTKWWNGSRERPRRSKLREKPGTKFQQNDKIVNVGIDSIGLQCINLCLMKTLWTLQFYSF